MVRQSMTRIITIVSRDGHEFDAACEGDAKNARGGVVILQEIFGLNSHIRSLAARFADAGFFLVAPALFDRAERGVELDYDALGKERGLALKTQVDTETLLDISATIAKVATAGPVSIVGFCWGGSLAWRAATSLSDLAGSVAYYGGEIPANANLTARCPVLTHFGTQDKSIPTERVKAFVKAQAASNPQVVTHTYDADHGFNCDARSQYDQAAANLAWRRTLNFLDEVSDTSPHR